MKNILVEHNFHWIDKKYNLKYRDFEVDIEKTNKITVITGLRRVGKSSIVKKIIDDLNVNKFNKFYINFFEGRLEKYKNSEGLEEIFQIYLKEFYEKFGDKNQPIYIFFDEIQEVELWHKWVLGKYETDFYNIKFVLTGSNADLLSSDIGTYLVGRHNSYYISPLSLKEFFNWKKFDLSFENFFSQKNKFLNLIDEYFENGGLPEKVLGENVFNNLIEDILYKDIIKKYGIKNDKNIKNLLYYLLENFSTNYSYNSLMKSIGSSNENTIKDYLGYFKKSFLLNEIEKIDFSFEKRLKSNKKTYLVDHALGNFFSLGEKKGLILENLVFNILNKNNSVFYSGENKEVDFVVLDKKNKLKGIYQVCYNLKDKKTFEREKSSLIYIAKKYGVKEDLFIISYNEESCFEEDGFKIKILPFWKMEINFND